MESKPCGSLSTALELFRNASKTVPAYSQFLGNVGIEPNDVKTRIDFEALPITSKENYLRKYPLPELCWNGSLTKALTFTCTSGSTGDPIYFPRNSTLDSQASWVHELFYNYRENSRENSTLVLVCFGMGVWIGGIITYQAFRSLGEKGYPISVLTPGINKQEIFKALRLIAPHFASTIIVGYAPFVKDIVDEAPSHGISISSLNPRFIFAAETFTEKFRDYIAARAGVQDVLLDTMNIYGSADLGTMAFETPLAILMRRLARRRSGLSKDVFSAVKKTATLCQYNPEFIHFENREGSLLLTGDNSIPLIRYDIGDRGGVWSFDEMLQLFCKRGADILQEAERRGITRTIKRYPFVFVYERSDLSTTLYGLKVYPDNIKNAFLEESLCDELTGKFTIVTRFDRRQNQFLEINVELREGRKGSSALAERALPLIVKHFEERNAAFRELAGALGRRTWPKIVFWAHEDPKYFKSGIKQAWVKPS